MNEWEEQKKMKDSFLVLSEKKLHIYIDQLLKNVGRE